MKKIQKALIGVGIIASIVSTGSAFAATSMDTGSVPGLSTSLQDVTNTSQYNDANTGMVGGNTESDENEVNNEDSYVVDKPTVHSGSLILNNIGDIEISDTLYVYGDMIVSNADSFVVTGKLRVTGKLQVNNCDLTNKGGRIYFGKKKISNGALKGKAMKVLAELTKIDPLLKVDLTDEEWKDLVAATIANKTELAGLRKELAAAKKAKADTTTIVEKILANREAFFAEVTPLVQEEDQDAIDKLQAADLKSVKRLFGIK